MYFDSNANVLHICPYCVNALLQLKAVFIIKLSDSRYTALHSGQAYKVDES